MSEFLQRLGIATVENLSYNTVRSRSQQLLRLDFRRHLFKRANATIQLLVLFKHLRGKLRRVIPASAEQRRDFTRTLVRLAIIRERSHACDELNPRQSLRTFP